MSNEEAALGASRRTPRQGVGGSPVGSWLTIVLAVIAVIVGFLILNNITGDSGVASTGTTDSDVGVTDTSDTLVDVVLPDATTTTTTTTIVRTTTGSSVLVANANTVGGSAGNMTRTLELAGYDMIADPVNATGPNIIGSIIYFDSAQASAEAVANSVARDLGGVSVLPVPTPAPTTEGNLGSAGVLVLLGDDQAGKTLEELAVTDDAATETVEEGVAAPDPSSGDAETDADAETDEG